MERNLFLIWETRIYFTLHPEQRENNTTQKWPVMLSRDQKQEVQSDQSHTSYFTRLSSNDLCLIICRK